MTRLPTAVPIAVVLAVAGCGHAAPPPPKSTALEVSYDELLSQKNINRQISLTAGDTLRIVLGSNASTGYQWAVQFQISDTAVITQTSHQTVAPDVAKPGAAGTEVWSFDALKAGSASLRTTYGQPWEGGTKDAWTFTAEVTVR